MRHLVDHYVMSMLDVDVAPRQKFKDEGWEYCKYIAVLGGEWYLLSHHLTEPTQAGNTKDYKGLKVLHQARMSFFLWRVGGSTVPNVPRIIPRMLIENRHNFRMTGVKPSICPQLMGCK